jgi:hypothetical protein
LISSHFGIELPLQQAAALHTPVWDYAGGPEIDLVFALSWHFSLLMGEKVQGMKRKPVLILNHMALSFILPE